MDENSIHEPEEHEVPLSEKALYLILEDHKKWLESRTGSEGRRANLANANLINANLRGC